MVFVSIVKTMANNKFLVPGFSEFRPHLLYLLQFHKKNMLIFLQLFSTLFNSFISIFLKELKRVEKRVGKRVEL